MELFSSKKHRLWKMLKHDLFNLVIVCSREIDENLEVGANPQISWIVWSLLGKY